MAGEKPTEPLGEDFIRQSFDFMKESQKRSLLWSITSWQEHAANPTACLLVNTETLFPKFAHLDPKVAKFLPEVYACIDQLLIALTHASADLHRSAETCDQPERNRITAVAEILKCIATHVYTIRVLAQTGFDVQVKQILRTYTEYLELLALVCADQGALDEFIASRNSDGANDFWHRHLSKAKARKKRYLNSALKANRPQEEQEKDRRWHEREARLLSESVHPTINAVLRSGTVSYDPFITPDDHEDVIGSLIYAFTVFADTLEVPTLEYIRINLKKGNSAEGEETDDTDTNACSRFYLIFMLAVILGYRKDYVFWGQSNIEKDFESALENDAAGAL